MRDQASSPEREKAATDLWKHTLSQIRSNFGRMVYLSSLRDANTGEYRHHGLAMMAGAQLAAQTLESSHLDVFREWISLSLEEQHGDLAVYLTEQEAGISVIVASWTKLAPYRNLVPAGAIAEERDLFFSDVAALLAVLRNEYGVEHPDPNE
jgi:hypothetical protein